MPLLGAAPINPTYHYLVGNRGGAPGILYVMTAARGFGEETVFRAICSNASASSWERAGRQTLIVLPHHRIVWTGATTRPRARRRRAGDLNRDRVRHDLRSHGPALDG